jgi:hypothetical protein
MKKTIKLPILPNNKNKVFLDNLQIKIHSLFAD